MLGQSLPQPFFRDLFKIPQSNPWPPNFKFCSGSCFKILCSKRPKVYTDCITSNFSLPKTWIIFTNMPLKRRKYGLLPAFVNVLLEHSHAYLSACCGCCHITTADLEAWERPYRPQSQKFYCLPLQGGLPTSDLWHQIQFKNHVQSETKLKWVARPLGFANPGL